MGKAANRRRKHREEYLAKLSHLDPVRFEAEWERRVESWIREIEYRIEEWKRGGIESWRQVFEIADRAISVIRQCSSQARQKHLRPTIDLFEHLCSLEVAKIVDRRLYRTNLMDPDRFKVKSHRSRKETGGWK
jgi:hypothetical protein